MEYSTIFAKSFSRREQKKFGFGAFLGSLIILLSILTVFKPSFRHLQILNQPVSMHAGLAVLMFEDTSTHQLTDTSTPQQKDSSIVQGTDTSTPQQEDASTTQGTDTSTPQRTDTTTAQQTDTSIPQQEDASTTQGTDTSTPQRTGTSTAQQTDTNTNQRTDTSTPQQKDTSTPQGTDTSTPQQKDTSTAQGTDTSTPQRTDTSTPQQKDTRTAQGTDTSTHQRTDTSTPQQTDRTSQQTVVHGEIKQKIKPLCNTLEARSDFCIIDGDIRIHGNSSTIFFSSSQVGVFAGNDTWKIRPYARKYDTTVMGFVNELSVKPIVDNRLAPRCTLNHSVPAIVFSTGGYAGNHFHDFGDILVPLFVTSRQFGGEVQFLVTNARSFWLSKYKNILNGLSRYEIIDMDRENEVNCFPSVTVGLFQFHEDLRMDPSKSPNGYSMKDFRQFLRSSYSLKKKTAIKIRGRKRTKPRLLIISRKGTRSFTNEGDIVKMAESLGFSVVVAEPGMTSLSKFAHIINSCDVMMGVHGAGLTNLVFLPTNAILIQIVPLGITEWISSHSFGNPAPAMNIRYLEYKIREEESTLIQQYPLDHAVFRDPMSIHKQGWKAISSIYLGKQNVKLDVGRFKGTLLESLKLLHH